MNIQEVFVFLLFLLAVVYIGRILFKSFKTKNSCGQNCKCGVDFSKITIPEKK